VPKPSTSSFYHNQKEIEYSQMSDIVNTPGTGGTELAHVENLGKVAFSQPIPSFVGVSVMVNNSNLGRQEQLDTGRSPPMTVHELR
jgi:hypothetical protein